MTTTTKPVIFTTWNVASNCSNSTYMLCGGMGAFVYDIYLCTYELDAGLDSDTDEVIIDLTCKTSLRVSKTGFLTVRLN